MHPESTYGLRAAKVGLDPAKTSTLGLCCVENGLPYDSSFIALAAKKAGKESISIAEAERIFGKNWTDVICK